MHETIVGCFFATATRRGTRDALRHKEGGAWRSISWADYAERVRRAARGLIGLGLEPGEAVVIMAHNRWEWLVSSLAVMAAGGVPASIYPTSTREQATYIARHCGAKIAIVEDAVTAAKLDEAAFRLGQRVFMDGQGDGRGAQSFTSLLSLGEGVAQAELDARMEALRPDALATLIYTSGTTGEPKGVMLSNDNLVFAARATIEAFRAGDEEELISYLPLSHIAEQLMSIHIPAVLGVTVSIAESLEKLGEDLRDVRPTIFFAVPRVWEKFEARIREATAKAPRWRRALARAAGRVGLRASRPGASAVLRPVGWGLAERLVFRKVRARLGLDRCHVAVSGAAPLGRATQDFFLALGIPILETYGLTESTGPVVLSTKDAWRLGTTGVAIPGSEIRIAPDDGEILVRGRHVFMGYLGDEQATREAKDAHGWLHTGDIGEMDERGFLRITDRKKDLIVTAGAKNVAPQRIEAMLKTIPGVLQAAVVGDRRKFLAALLTLDPDASLRIARERGLAASSTVELAAHPGFQAYVREAIDAVNRDLARYETIKRFHLLARELTVESGELTPTLKIKRKVVAMRYGAEIEAMYHGD
ncbi:MAG: AMP-dependent synthetase/ligase [Sandaracinaceae bacterium]|nr:AMP-dependent synthetase/ligase [Sandaracinaceae bacterium]